MSIEQEIKTVETDVTTEAKSIAESTETVIAKAETEVEAVAAKVDQELTTEVKYAIRTAQLELLRIDNQYKELQTRAIALTKGIDALVQQEASRLGKDLKTVILDIESLVFKARAAVEKPL